MIDLQADMVVVAAAATGEEAIGLFRRHQPEVTLMDLQLPGMSGIEAIRRIRSEWETARIIVLTMYQGDEDMARAFDAGAQAYLLKDTLSQDLIRTVREVYRGEHTIQHVGARGGEGRAHLTPREVQITELIGEGMRNKEIASALGIAEETVHAHVKRIFTKLRVNDRTAALATAIRRGFIHIR